MAGRLSSVTPRQQQSMPAVGSRCNTTKSLRIPNTYSRHPIACRYGRAIECLLCVQSIFLHLSRSFRSHYDNRSQLYFSRFRDRTGLSLLKTISKRTNVTIYLLQAQRHLLSRFDFQLTHPLLNCYKWYSSAWGCCFNPLCRHKWSQVVDIFQPKSVFVFVWQGVRSHSFDLNVT